MPDFESQLLMSELESVSDEALDVLQFGVIGLDANFTCSRYNAYESAKAGLSQSRVIGHRHPHW